jgi:hypothetical protein
VASQTWILTGSLENFRINVERGFDVIGMKERRRRQAEQMRAGDEIVFYVTGVQEFGGIARVTSEMYEDRTPIWPSTNSAASPPDQPVAATSAAPSTNSAASPPDQPVAATSAAPRQRKKKRPEPYPWRIDAEPDLILDEEDFVPAVELVDELEHVRKWPAEHWQLAFQGQLRTVGAGDGRILRERIEAAAKAAAR